MCFFIRKIKLIDYQKKDNLEFIDKKIYFWLIKIILFLIIFVKVYLNFFIVYYIVKLKLIGMIN